MQELFASGSISLALTNFGERAQMDFFQYWSRLAIPSHNTTEPFDVVVHHYLMVLCTSVFPSISHQARYPSLKLVQVVVVS